MIQAELSIPVSYQVGQKAWWTPGLRYMTTTYPRKSMRDENQYEVTILEISGEKAIILDLEDNRTVHIHTRWLSPVKGAPCPAVLEANGVYFD